MTRQRPEEELNFGRKILLAAVGIAVVAGTVLLGLVDAPLLRAQSSQAGKAPLPSFEVASIKQDHSQDNSDTKTRLFQFPSPGRFHTINMPVKLMIQFAYNINPSQISGGPSWVGSQGWVIDAKVDDSLVPDLQTLPSLQQRDRMRLMVRSLLADRFKLILSHGTKELPIYALVVTKGGPKLKPTTYTPPDSSVPPPSEPPQNRPHLLITPGKISAVNQPLSGLAETLALLPDLAGRTVEDQTGIKGNYDFEVEFAQQDLSPNLPAGAGSPSINYSGPLIFTALQEQLGLKLETTKSSVETYIIDHIEEPSEN